MQIPSAEWLKDAAERVVMTFLASFAVAWLASPTLNVEQNKAFALAALTAAVTLVKTLVAGIITGGASVAPSTSTAAVAAKTS